MQGYTDTIDEQTEGLRRLIAGLEEHRQELWDALDDLPNRIGKHKRLADYDRAIHRETQALVDNLWKFRVGLETELKKSLEQHECSHIVMPVSMAEEEFRVIWAMLGDHTGMPGHGYFNGLWWPRDYAERNKVCDLLDFLEKWEKEG